MADLSSNSFIPKRGPAKRRSRNISRQVYVFTIISYVLMFATLLATAGVYAYSQHIDSRLTEEVTLLTQEKDTFSEADMHRVLEFDERLSQAADRFNHSVSLVTIFKALEAATANTVQIESLSLEREFDQQYLLTATLGTDTFDSTIFQRDEYWNNGLVSSVLFEEVSAPSQLETSSNSNNNEENADSESPVTFEAKIEIPIAAIPYEGVSTAGSPLTITREATTLTTDEGVEGESVDGLEESVETEGSEETNESTI
jgi:hypothetical protein